MKESIEVYEKTPHWKNLSKKLLAPVDVVCEICGKPHWAIAKRQSKIHANRHAGTKYSIRRFAAHHKHYKHPYHETREDIMVICNSCHETGHKLADLSRQEMFTPLYTLWKEITGWESEKNDGDR